MAYLEPKIYSELCQGIFGHIKNAVQQSHIENPYLQPILAYLGLEAYSESCLYRHIQVYAGIIINDSCNNINFLFSP